MTMRCERHHKSESLKRPLEDPAIQRAFSNARPVQRQGSRSHSQIEQ
jgi:hypothetical protein